MKEEEQTTDQKIDKLKWQIHAETSILQIMFWWIIILLTENQILFYLSTAAMAGNFITMFRSSLRIGKDYFRK